MAARKTTTLEVDGVQIHAINMQTDTVCVVGTSPLIMNRQSEKMKRELLFPSRKKNQTALEQRLKHEPWSEYRASVYRDSGDSCPTRLVFPGSAFRRAMASVAVDIPGPAKAAVGRLVRVVEFNVSIYGTPHIYCAVTRCKDIARTPDVRTRAILPEWACVFQIRYGLTNGITGNGVLALLGNAGEIIGIGDYRNEKGAGSFGCFSLVRPDDVDFVRICKEQGREAQDDALENPLPYDVETEELLSWFDEEVKRREKEKQQAEAVKDAAKAERNGKRKSREPVA